MSGASLPVAAPPTRPDAPTGMADAPTGMARAPTGMAEAPADMADRSAGDGFAWRDGRLMAGQLALQDLAAHFGTPLYVYDAGILAARIARYRSALDPLGVRLCYAVKANSTLAILEQIRAAGLGADIVSGGELERALAAGMAPADIVFAGVGKTAHELNQALAAGIGQFNVESAAELDLLDQVARTHGRPAPVVLRVNPDVDPRTHAKIATGQAEAKFGIPAADALALYRRAASLPGLRPLGFAVHIGSQLTELGPYEQAYSVLADLTRQARSAGLQVHELDLGGGLGIRYRPDQAEPDLSTYAALVGRVLGPLEVRLTMEPGRSLIGPAGCLVTRVLQVKPGRTRQFAIVDAAMNDLLRPTLYEAWHEITPVLGPPAALDPLDYDVVGPICESGDYFARGRRLPILHAGDVVAILSAGAYGSVMASFYNSRPLVGEVLVSGGRVAVIRPPLPTATLIAQEQGWQFQAFGKATGAGD